MYFAPPARVSELAGIARLSGSMSSASTGRAHVLHRADDPLSGGQQARLVATMRAPTREVARNCAKWLCERGTAGWHVLSISRTSGGAAMTKLIATVFGLVVAAVALLSLVTA